MSTNNNEDLNQPNDRPQRGEVGPELQGPIEEYPGRHTKRPEQKRNVMTPHDRKIWHSILLLCIILVWVVVWLFFALGVTVKGGAVLILVGLAGTSLLLRGIRPSSQQLTEKLRGRFRNPIKPTRRCARYIDTEAGETVIQDTPRHPICLVPWILGAITIFAVESHFLWLNPLYVYIGTLAVLAIATFFWWHTRICFTSTRVFTVHGLVGRTKREMSYKKMTDKTVSTPWHSVILHFFGLIEACYGTLVLESAGQDQALTRIRFVPFAEEIDKVAR